MTGTESPTVELFVRSLSLKFDRSPADDHLDRLSDLADRGLVDLTVSVWGREVGLSTTASRTDAGEYVLDRVATVRQWADRHGVSVAPFFQERRVESGLTGETYATLVLPVTCLAEYRDGALVHATPHVADSSVHSVCDHLERLAAIDDHDRPRSDSPVAVELQPPIRQ